MSVSHSDFPHLSTDEWAAIELIVAREGTETAFSVLNSGSAEEQRTRIFSYVHQQARAADAAREEAKAAQEQALAASARAEEASLREAEVLRREAEVHQRLLRVVERQQHAAHATARESRVEPLKLDVSKFRASEGESLARWLVELETAISARCIKDPLMQVAFAMSNLAGRAKSWSFGKRLADPTCFATYDEFKYELKLAFEPPKTEFRYRTEFLALKQGKRDVHAYSEQARYLVSCIVNRPIDEDTKVSTFMTGLNDGPVKTYLFRAYPETLEEAISLAIQEDFSLNQAYVHSHTYRQPRNQPVRERDMSEPMDISAVEVRPQQGRRQPTCHRCQKAGHLAYECLAPRPASRATSSSGRVGPSSGQRAVRPQRNGGRFAPRAGGKPKNDKSQ